MGLSESETRYWFFKMLREEKEIAKLVLKKLKVEERRKFKQMAKKWKIDYDKYFDPDYEDFDEFVDENEDHDNINSTASTEESKRSEPEQIPQGFKNLTEVVFFEDNKHKMIYYKKTLSNIREVILSIFDSPKNRIREEMLGNLEFNINDLFFNKAITVLYVYFSLPELETFKPKADIVENANGVKDIKISYSHEGAVPTEEEKRIKDEIYKDIEQKLNKASKFIASCINSCISFKYVIDIRFSKDPLIDDLMKFSEIVSNMETNRNKKHGVMNHMKEQAESYLHRSNQFYHDILKHVINDTVLNLNSNARLKAKIVNLVSNFKAKSFHEFVEELKKQEDLSKTQFVAGVLKQYNDLLEISKYQSPQKPSSSNEESKTNNLKSSDLKLLMKYNLSVNDIKGGKKERNFDTNKIMQSFVEGYTREKPVYESSSNINEMTDIRKDLRNLMKTKVEVAKQEKNQQEILKEMMFKNVNHLKANKKAVDFWKSLDNQSNH